MATDSERGPSAEDRFFDFWFGPFFWFLAAVAAIVWLTTSGIQWIGDPHLGWNDGTLDVVVFGGLAATITWAGIRRLRRKL